MSSLVLTVAAAVIAIAAIAYAWRLARQERRRAEARVAALAAAIDGGTASVEPAAPLFELETRAFDPEASMFGREPRTGLQGRPLLKIGVGFAMAVLAIVLIAMSGDFHEQPADAAQATNDASAPTLELLSMRHVRSGSGLKVTGLVRSNAAAGDPSMMAVVFVFDRDGGFVASGRAPLEFGAIAKGDESPFQVTVPDVKDVGRYRVSFRTGAGLVPHVDRRTALQVSAN